MNRGVYRSFVISSRVESKYRWGPQDCVPKFVPELNVRKNKNIRATGENHNMRSSLIGLQVQGENNILCTFFKIILFISGKIDIGRPENKKFSIYFGRHFLFNNIKEYCHFGDLQ